MTMLAPLQQVVSRLGLGSLESFVSPDKVEQLASAMEGATLQLEAVLRTEFQRSDRLDRYYVNPREFPYTDQFPKLYLSQGFVVGGCTIGTATTKSDLAEASALDTDTTLLDATKGLVMLLNLDPYPLFASASYTAGFTETDGVYDNVPDWLAEAAIRQAIYIYHTHKPCDDAKAPCDISLAPLLEGHVRFYPSALKPLV